MGKTSAPSPIRLRRRLAVGVSACVTLLWLAATLLGSWHVRQEIDEVSDSALQEVVQRVLPLAYTEILARDSGDMSADVVAPVGAHREYITYIVRAANGSVLMQSHDAEPARFPTQLATGFTDGPDARFYTDSAARGTIFVTAGEREGHRLAGHRKATLALLGPLLLLFPMVLLATWWLVGLAFRPVTLLGQEIEARGGGNLSAVETTAIPLEIRPVALAVNALLDRLRRAIAAERSFTANSAHELRTPVAGALAQVQRLIAELDEGGAKQRAREVERSLRRLAQLSEKLLQLAKAEGGALLAPEPHDLTPVLDLVMRDFAERARLRRVDADPVAPVLSPVDVDAFAILARNLIENALKHGQPDTPVLVSLTPDGAFRVINHGAVIPPAARASLLERFSRGATQAEGTGLGLAIVAAIAGGIGTHLEIFSPACGQPDGVEMRVRFPVAPPHGLSMR